MAKHSLPHSSDGSAGPRTGAWPGLAAPEPAAAKAPRTIRIGRPANDNPLPLHLRLKWLAGAATLAAAVAAMAWLL